MTLRWVPEWIKININIDNKPIEVCLDKVTKLISCPLCTPIRDLCPSSDKPLTGVVPKNATYFFSIDDLAFHLREHQQGKRALNNKIYYGTEDDIEDHEDLEY